MHIHPEFDIKTKTWFFNKYEAPSIRELVSKIEKRLGKRVTVEGYNQKGDTRVVYPVESAPVLRPSSPNLISFSSRRFDAGDNRGRSAKDMTKEERLQAREDVLNLWSTGKSVREIAATLNLKFNYVGSNIIPAARKAGDPRANPRNRVTFGVPKGARVPDGSRYADGDT